MFASCSPPYLLYKIQENPEMGINCRSFLKKAIILDLVSGIVVVAFALLNSYMGIELSPEVFYITLGIGASYAFTSLAHLIHITGQAEGTHKRILIAATLLIGISSLALGFLGIKLGFLSSHLSYALIGIGSANSFNFIISEFAAYGTYRILKKSGDFNYHDYLLPNAVCIHKKHSFH